ncbi:MAG: DUF1003 domain-containing protein [Candidatus Eremiobacteraeota bacterium]|nr:DUF1003 domain-containing protein [Candidatus Eremiobacteraeota bacterium]
MDPEMPAHVEDTVRSVAELHAEHSRRASLYQRMIERLIAQLSRPACVGAIATIIIVWIGANLVLRRLNVDPFDPAPFPYLQGLITAAALFMTVLILVTQRRENALSEHRAQLTLQLALVNEQKVAKLIELLEQLRRDDPFIANRVDDEAAAMAHPTDPQAMFDAIKDTHDEMIAQDND